MGEGLNCPETIKNTDIRSEVPTIGGTVIIVQRHEDYIRAEGTPMLGHLEEQAAVRARDQSEKIFGEIMCQIPEKERGAVGVLVVASDTKRGTGQRCIETAQETMAGINKVLDENGLSESQLLNTQEGRFRGDKGPRPTTGIREPKIFTNSPEFVKFLTEKYGTGKSFWQAFEEDTEEAKRKEMGAEGPWELAERLDKFINALARYSDAYHRENSGNRLVVWVVTHYDIISPYVKRYLAEIGKEKYIPINYGAGFSINIRPDGKATTTIGENVFRVPIRSHLI